MKPYRTRYFLCRISCTGVAAQRPPLRDGSQRTHRGPLARIWPARGRQTVRFGAQRRATVRPQTCRSQHALRRKAERRRERRAVLRHLKSGPLTCGNGSPGSHLGHTTADRGPRPPRDGRGPPRVGITAKTRATTYAAQMTNEQRALIVRDPRVCHGQATVPGTRIMVSIIFDALADGLTNPRSWPSTRR